jgi:hypothetical protein
MPHRRWGWFEMMERSPLSSRWCYRLLILLFRLLALLVAWLSFERTVLRRKERRRQRPSSPADCHPIPSTMYRRPDPLIYDQYYLASQGLAVTWDNPDIHIEQNGVVVDPHDLKPAERYDVVARVWNGSTGGVVADLPVMFSYLSFGIGGQSHPIGQAQVDLLGVKGSTQCPGFATASWITPPQPGHYCVQAELVWFDDANPYNNLGQTNTDVRPLNSPIATFLVAVSNPRRDGVVLVLRADSYVIPPPVPCPPPGSAGGRVAEVARARLAEQRADRQSTADGWRVTIDRPQLELGPGESVDVTVELLAPDGFAGTQPFNLNAFDARGRLFGGVTLYAHS